MNLGETPLHKAVYKNHFQVVKILLKSGIIYVVNANSSLVQKFIQTTILNTAQNPK